ncbi:MAG: EAL domain-containing protein [Sulfuricella sp.]|nr:EAL domain-containing protein [Sulfuricella sp.]
MASRIELLKFGRMMIAVLLMGFMIQALVFLPGAQSNVLENLALHGAIEMAGSIVSAMVAYLLLRLNAIKEGSSYNYRIAAALLAISFLDGLHAIQPPGNAFVWLHSAATGLGGLLFAMVWLPTGSIARVLKYWPAIAALSAGMFGAYSFLQPEHLPLMIVAENFTPSAVTLNVGGGILFGLAAIKLFLSYKTSGKTEDLLFFFQCLMLAFAAIMFKESRIWDLTWWGWHLQRLAGYAVALWLVVKVANGIEEKTLVANRLLSFQVEERKRIEEQLRIAATTFETHEGIMITDAYANIIRVNNAFETITGYRAEEVLGKNPRMLSSGRHDKAFFASMWKGLRNDGVWSGEVWDRNKAGGVYPKDVTITAVKDETGKTTQYVSIFSDISERKKAEEEIFNLAFYDALTQLPNRRLLRDRLNTALAASQREKKFGALIFLDLDNFKTLNDTMGHDAGDALLIEVARRLSSVVREIDTVARLGGDEFVVLIVNAHSNEEEAAQHIAHLAEKIRTVLTMPYPIMGGTHFSSPSIGVCLFHGTNEPVEELIKRADMAMYQAKSSGRNRVQFFDPVMQQAVACRIALESDLRQALVEQQFQLHYQVQMDKEVRPVGAEALIRWVHPARGMVSPAEFIPIAEETALILEIGKWVLETACQQLEKWSHDPLTQHLVLAVNISAQQFKQEHFVETVAGIIGRFSIVPSQLKLELTEGVVLGDVDSVIEKMLAIRHVLGLTLSLDDFGTGYSSLSYLKRLPLDQIKIDQSFIRDLTTDPNDAMMIKTIIDMAENFGLNVIAEGVENEHQLQHLQEIGCMAYQGYYFSKPVPAEQFYALMKKFVGEAGQLN